MEVGWYNIMIMARLHARMCMRARTGGGEAHEWPNARSPPYPCLRLQRAHRDAGMCLGLLQGTYPVSTPDKDKRVQLCCHKCTSPAQSGMPLNR